MIDEKKIEEAARKESHKIWGSNDRYLYEEGFKAGINWFEENLWHDASEEPKQDKRLLTERKVVDTLIHEVHITTSQTLTWDYLKKHYTTITRWLYIEDLMKGGK